ncbi:MAG: LysM peptidoglycan-binding domain-containing protein, partial [Anaerolineae bacterium]|nr:LysM peptidoglycan-binding domain-containing protein [Anaerolineae bacterium]
PTFTPEPTPTPVVHMVESGDTLLGIAVEYGVQMEAIQQVNGLEDVSFLRVGQALIIPLEVEGATLEPQLLVPAGNFLLPTPTPLPLSVVGVGLYQTPVGGIWCMGEVLNTTDGPVTNLQIQATLLDTMGTPLASKVVLAAADYLPAGATAPFAVLFSDFVTGAVDVHIDLLRSEAISEITAGFIPLEADNVVGTVSGPHYRVTGTVANRTEAVLEHITVVVTLYDKEGNTIGYRQTSLNEEVQVFPGEEHTFALLLTPQGLDSPADYRVLVWATKVN